MTHPEPPVEPTPELVPGGAARIPTLSTRSSRLWVGTTVVGSVAVVAYLFVTQPENRIFVVTLIPVLAVFFVVLLWQSTWFDPVAGTVTKVRCRLWRRTVQLEPATSVALVPTAGGTLLLALRPRGARRRVFILVLALTDYVEKSQSPALLRLLADSLEQHRAGGAADVVVALRAQAEHLEAGGKARTSPLAPLVTHGAMTAAKAGGAGAIGGNLLG
jgi:hypothetical protein